MCGIPTVILYDIRVALTTLSTCPSLCPPRSHSERTFWARSIMSVSTRRRTSCESALRRICCHTGRFSTSEGGKRATSSIWQQRRFRENSPFFGYFALYAVVLGAYWSQPSINYFLFTLCKWEITNIKYVLTFTFLTFLTWWFGIMRKAMRRRSRPRWDAW